MLIRKLSIGGLLTILCLCSNVYAATDGSLGATSTGSAGITVEIPARIKISKIADLAMGTWSASGNEAQGDDVCIFTNNPTGNYQVTATGNGTNGAFTLNDGQGNILDYRIKWNDQIGETGNVEVSSGVALTGQTGACTTSDTCGDCGGNNANIRVIVDNSELSTALAGSYSGTVSITVEPN